MYELNIKYIEEKLKNNEDIVYKDIACRDASIKLIFCRTITDREYISKFIVTPLLENKDELITIEDIINRISVSGSVEEEISPETAVISIMSGAVVILFELSDRIISYSTMKFTERAIEKPQNEPAIKGPQQGFIESIDKNINMLRKRIKTPLLKIENFTVGKMSKTKVVMIYIEGRAPENLTAYLRQKINCLNNDFILDTSYIEEELRCKDTNFDTIGYTERPDIVTSRLFEGRVAIMVDGTPMVITAPNFFFEYFQAADDYYLNKNVINITRVVRITSFLITVLLPGFYVALFTNHISLIPQVYVFKIAEGRAGVPLPTAIEVVVMLLFFELTRETGRRLPAYIGQTISIVSSLILGETATRAGVTSEGTVIIMAIYGMTSFMNPKISNVTPFWSFVNIIMSIFFGLHGFFIFIFLMLASIANLNSCGYPYLFPFGTSKKYNFYGKDYIIRSKLKDISNKIFRGGK